MSDQDIENNRPTIENEPEKAEEQLKDEEKQPLPDSTTDECVVKPKKKKKYNKTLRARNALRNKYRKQIIRQKKRICYIDSDSEGNEIEKVPVFKPKSKRLFIPKKK